MISAPLAEVKFYLIGKLAFLDKRAGYRFVSSLMSSVITLPPSASPSAKQSAE